MYKLRIYYVNEIWFLLEKQQGKNNPCQGKHREFGNLWGLQFSTYAPRGKGGGSSLLYISIAYYMQRGGGGSR